MLTNADTHAHPAPSIAEPAANLLVHTDDGPYSESADGKSGVHPGWWIGAFLACGAFWLAVAHWFFAK